MDESGSHDGSPVIVVAACYAKASAWRQFCQKWNFRKRPINVLHAVDVQNLSGEFKGWKSSDRDQLVKRLLPTFPECDIHGVVIGIDMNALRAALKGKPELMPLFGTPYSACFHWVVAELKDAFNRWNVREPLAFIHEVTELKREAVEAFEYIWGDEQRGGRKPTLEFQAKNKCVPLQAADVTAYEANKFLRNPTTDWSKTRRALQAINPNAENFILRAFGESQMDWLVQRLTAIYSEVAPSEKK